LVQAAITGIFMGEGLKRRPAVCLSTQVATIAELHGSAHGWPMTNHAALAALETIIDLRNWRRDENFEYHPIGTKPKRNYICPPDLDHPGLIGGHTYLFKIARGFQAYQMWSEALAYQLGAAAGLDVPRCFVAVDPLAGEWGCLIEFFVGYPGQEAPSRLIHGADLLQGRGFTVGSDRPHNLRTNIEACESEGVANAREWWLRLVSFDALIGNMDRHTENWGLLVDSTNVTSMAPVFDNGSSLGNIIKNEQIADYNGERLEKFIARGTHHMSWDLANETRTGHMDLCKWVVADSKSAGAILADVIQSAKPALDGALEACLRLPVELAFTPERADFVRRLLDARSRMLLEIVEGS